jgi:hypothetical protein
VASFAAEGRTCGLRYEVDADGAFRSRRAVVEGFVARQAVALRARATAQGRWEIDGRARRDLDGCLDIDLNFTPATNLLAVRRLALRVGDSADAPAAWLEFPSLQFEVLPQSYRRISREDYAYAAPTVGYRGNLRVSRVGAVIDYPGLFELVGAR